MLFYKGDIRRIHSLESLEENFADRSSDVKAPSCEASSNFIQTCEPLDRTDHEHPSSLRFSNGFFRVVHFFYSWYNKLALELSPNANTY